MPIHPVIVHFPIVLSVLLLVLEFRKDVSNSLKTFILSTFAFFLTISFFTGLSDSSLHVDISEQAQSALVSHYNLSRIVFFLGLCLVALDFFKIKLPAHSNLLSVVYRVLLLLVVVLMFNTGLKGGQLVYQEGIGVKTQEKTSFEK